jgi:hypothetical protein
MYSDPNFINKLDKSRDDIYRTTKQVNGQPNPAYEATWKPRVNIWGPYSAPATPSNTSGKTVEINGVVYHEGDTGYEEAKKKADEAFKPYQKDNGSTAQPPYKVSTGPVATPQIPTVDVQKKVGDIDIWANPTDINGNRLPASVNLDEDPKISFKRPTNDDSDIENIKPVETDSDQSSLKSDAQTSTNFMDLFPKDPDDARYNNLSSADQKKFDQSLIGKQSSRQQRRHYKNWFNEKYANDQKPKTFFEQQGIKTGLFDTAKNIFPAITSTAQYFNDKAKQRDYDNWFRNQKFSKQAAVVPQSTSGLHGNYAVTGSSYGKFRYPEMGFTNEGRYFNNPGLKVAASGGIIDEELYLPSDEIQIEQPTPSPNDITSTTNVENPPKKHTASKGVNPMAQQTWNDFSSAFKGVSNLGIWGDKKHQSRVSDHNTGDALDIGITNTNMGNQIAQKLINEAAERNIKYLIFNRRIWSPSKGWETYTPNASNGNNPHTSHVHVSFYRPQGGEVDQGTSDINISNWDHYNPGNIHIGDFAKSYGAKAGRKDGNGRVAIFPDMKTGLKAMEDLIFGPGYINLSVEQARNRWVNGDSGVFTNSSPYIVSALGGNKLLKDLNREERKKLVSEFIKWEDRKVYNKLLSQNLVFENGGSIDNTIPNNMKIRITGAPNQKMAYGGQSGYGFDLGQRNTYSAMSQNPYEESSNTLQPVPREEANIEAEEGETVYGDLDKDGQREHMVIGGKKHSQGGTPLNVPTGSFIYSDTKKMKIKDKDILKFFGMPSSGSYTPAEIAKKYDINRYKAILADPYADGIKKRTAELMIKGAEKKLAYLAFIQEEMKGFPQGIPEVAKEVLGGNQQPAPNRPQAPLEPEEESTESPEQQNPEEEQMEQQPPMMYGGEGYYNYGGAYIPNYGMAYGGIPYADEGLEVTDDDPSKKKKYKLKDKEIEAEYTKVIPPGYVPYPGQPGLYWIPGKPGTITPGKTVKKAVPGGKAGKSWENWIINQLKNGVSIDELVKQGHGTKAGLSKYSSYYVPPTTTPGTDDQYLYTEDEPKPETPKWTCNPSGEGVIPVDPDSPIASSAVLYDSKEKAEAVCIKKKNNNDDGGGGGNSSMMSIGDYPMYTSQFMVGPKKYHPYAKPLDQYIPLPAYLDPSQELAANAALATTMSRGYTGSPAQYMAQANAAQMNAINNAANILGRYGNQNAAIANQYSPLQTNIMNTAMQYEADRADKLHYNENMYDKEYRNTLRKYLSDYDKLRKGQKTYNVKKALLNATNPYYNLIDTPNGAAIQMKPGVNAYNTVIGPGSVGGSNQQANYMKRLDELVSSKKYSDPQIKWILDREFPNSSSSSNSSMNAWNQAYINAMSGDSQD